MKKFDLNIEKILENWDLKHAVREVIANAIDEQHLTNSNEIQIFKDQQGAWHIRDFGRGLRYEHFTQKENDEKLSTDGIIGKFGIGLKDALATFERKGISVKILSRHGDITLGKSQKSGFDDLVTLHAYISDPSIPSLVGTDFVLYQIFDSDINLAKQLFLKFNQEQVVENTKYGQVLQKSGSQGNIYINGVLVATEDNFLFSYNITLLNSAIKKAINRERANVGRSAYQLIVKNILLSCESKDVADLLTNDLRQYSSGNVHDELKWLDVQQHAATILNKFQKVIFVTAEEIEKGTDLVDEARKGNFQVVAIPSNLRDKLIEQNKLELERQIDNPESTVEMVRTFNQFVQERNNNFEFKFIEESDLSLSEKAVWKLKDSVLTMIGGMPLNVHVIKISETMQKDSFTFQAADGLWQPYENRVIIKRSVLQSEQRFIGVLLHELAHAMSGATDATRAFESELTRLLGVIGNRAVLANLKY
ncbi:ATP-binding protein [Pontibacter indicus]|uniref:MPN635 N-terminal domain-containing protein n=1 Tax=Pontibacter indicus TaxID=1317125 RepID=A0A1R3XS27_9BACT|nr:ATP-binding protein [Pontibacter indicus]SIT94660.1 hypothetical protein SAMN05444128_3699 [Pontibacter indicus]